MFTNRFKSKRRVNKICIRWEDGLNYITKSHFNSQPQSVLTELRKTVKESKTLSKLASSVLLNTTEEKRGNWPLRRIMHLFKYQAE